MGSEAWTREDRAYLASLAERRDWIGEAVNRFPNRSEAAVRCMMQKVRLECGHSDTRFMENAWMADAVNGSRRLLEALQRAEVRP